MKFARTTVTLLFSLVLAGSAQATPDTWKVIPDFFAHVEEHFLSLHHPPSYLSRPLLAPRPTPTPAPLPGEILYAHKAAISYQVFVQNANGTNVRQLTTGPQPNVGPVAWSFDGTKITYVYGGARIYISNSDGTNPVNLSTERNPSDTAPSFSPDGATIVFTHIVSGSNPPAGYLYTVPTTSGTQTRILGDGRHLFAAAHYSPDGTKLVFESNIWYAASLGGPFQIYTCTVGKCAATATQITFGSPPQQTADPHWSPDGTKIVVSYGDRSGDLNVGLMNANGSNLVAITSYTCPSEAGDPNFDPTGNYITFEYDAGIRGSTSCVYQNNNNAPTWVYTVQTNGRNIGSTGNNCNNIGCSPRFNPIASPSR